MTDKEVVLRVIDVKKYFVLPQFKRTSVKNIFVDVFRANSKKTKQKVLDGISFDVRKGDFFGVVGRNGSGKSTLLKILAGVYQPSSGRVELNGKLTPFIELGVGFNPELSGRDNVYLNGALLGFTRKQMDEMYDEIVDFAELNPFMDQKLKNYSSGMQVRLAFSIAIKAKNDILIFDEVLAVGDEAFQRKCYDVFDDYKASGQTVILVTHDMGAIKNFCNRAVLIEDGHIVKEGEPQSIAAEYSELNQASTDASTVVENTKEQEKHTPKYISLKINDIDGNQTRRFRCEDRARFEVNINNLQPEEYESVGITIIRRSGEHIGGLNSRVFSEGIKWKKDGRLALEVEMNIMPGKYRAYVEIFRKPGELIDYLEGPTFSVLSKRIGWSGLTRLNAKWQELNDES